jgi:hypothetical protein
LRFGVSLVRKQLIVVAGRYNQNTAFGMVLTVLPTIAGYVWLVQRALDR